MNQVYLSDIPRLFTALAEWCSCLVFLYKRPLRFRGIRLWSILTYGKSFGEILEQKACYYGNI